MLDSEVPYLTEITEKLHASSPTSKQIDSWYKQMQEYKTGLLKEQENGLAVNTEAPNIVLQNPKWRYDTVKEFTRQICVVRFLGKLVPAMQNGKSECG
jgi:hypothetical protein